MLNNLEDVLSLIKERSVEQIDLKFVDLWGRWHHVTLPAGLFDQSLLDRGVGFDGSSVGFKTISSGDMVMVPDLTTSFLDPFWERTTLSFICTTLEADTRQLLAHDPRSVARRAEAYLAESGVGERSMWGPELEFYVFDHVTFDNGANVAAYRVESHEGFWRSREPGDGYTLPHGGGYHAIPPRDRLADLRSTICSHLPELGVPVKYHHHEVGGAGQCEIETPLLPLIAAADAVMLIKYVTRMVAVRSGLTATFLPKPVYGEAGSGMHCHQRLEGAGGNLFYDPNGYACLSEVARWYIGGLLHHGGAVLAFTNPSTNSYRRLVPGFEAPVSAIFSAGNRSAAVRIPKYANKPDSARFEFRPPDATCNPYLAMAAQLMAGIDGIQRKLDPSELGFGPVEEDIFSWPVERRRQIKALPTGLDRALDALEADHDFLLAGGVFDQGLIERWVARKRDEQFALWTRPHPFEVQLYYDI